jgi:hypothetical protein
MLVNTSLRNEPYRLFGAAAVALQRDLSVILLSQFVSIWPLATLLPRNCLDSGSGEFVSVIKQREGGSVKFHILCAGVISASLACPLAAQAQGIPDGVAHGVAVGGQAAGPIGGIVGGAVGGVLGGIGGLLGVQPASYPAPQPPVYRHHRHWRHHARVHKQMSS